MTTFTEDEILQALDHDRYLGPEPGTCQICGCSELDPCPGGCIWANPEATLCSRCAQEERPTCR